MTIRPMAKRDFDALDKWFGPGTEHGKPSEKWREHLRLAKEGAQIVIIAETDDQAVGFCALLRTSGYPPFQAANVPEINNLLVATIGTTARLSGSTPSWGMSPTGEELPTADSRWSRVTSTEPATT